MEFSRRSSCCFGAAKHLFKPHRPKIPNIYTDIELARQWLQPAVAVAVKIDPGFVHAAPSPERIVAEHKLLAIDIDFRIRLHAQLSVAIPHGRVIVVACDEMLASMQHF